MAMPHAASVTPARPAPGSRYDRRATAYSLSRGAISAGTAAAAVLALSLLMQGTGSGLGLSLITPSAYSAITSATFGVMRY